MEGGMTRCHGDCTCRLCLPHGEVQIHIRAPVMVDDIPLFMAIHYGSISAVGAALEAGANVNGHPDQPYAPIAVAIVRQRTGVVKYLLEHGADADKPVTVEVLLQSGVIITAILGLRALHIATLMENVEIIRLLLKGSRADPNGTDINGTNPLMTACSCLRVKVEVVRLLLQAGADPALANDKGIIPLHIAAEIDMPDLIDMLHSKAPVTLNKCTADGMTPLFVACNMGQERVVSKLLSLGAMQPGPSQKPGVCPLATTVDKDFVGVVRVLISEGGIKAVGGKAVLLTALRLATTLRRGRILRLLLTSDGVKRRSEFANSYDEDSYLLHYGASCCYPAAVSILLEAGADEAARGSKGHIARDVIGLGIRPELQIDRGKAVAIRRMLQRGPAYRARSWAWPSDEEAGASGAGDATAGDNGVAVGAATAAAVGLSPQDVKLPPVIVFWRKDSRSNKLFVSPLARYCAKD